MSTQPPPPTGQPQVVPPRSPRRRVRDLGLFIAFTFPISGFLLWIVIAIVFDEQWLEESLFGTALYGIPILVGLAVAARAHFAQAEPALPSVRSASIVAGLAGLVLIGLGGWSVVSSSDASIGGGILVLFGLATLIVSAVARQFLRS